MDTIKKPDFDNTMESLHLKNRGFVISLANSQIERTR